MFKNDEKQNKYDMDFFIKDIESLEKIIETDRKKAVQNKFRYKNREGFDKIRRLLCLEK